MAKTHNNNHALSLERIHSLTYCLKCEVHCNNNDHARLL